MWVLVTGAQGYIGSHLLVELCCEGHHVIAVDKVINPKVEAGIREILSQHQAKGKTIGKLHFSCCDLATTELYVPRACDVIIHLAALKSVAESVEQPLNYFSNNLNCLFNVLKCAKIWGNKPHFVFSSSATVYGEPTELPITEEHLLNPVNPYGQSKLMCEDILRAETQSPESVIGNVVTLRYFNPVGAHASGEIGEYCGEKPTNLMPILCQVAAKQRKHLDIYRGAAAQSPTRDYLHIMDLVEAHVASIAFCTKCGTGNKFEAINLGRGHGVQVTELVDEMEKAIGAELPTRDAEVRPGDVPEMFASADKAKRLLEWEAKRDLQDMCASAWNFYTKNCM